ncbi:hypothetical protein [Rhizobium mongolense]|uniref:Uncharacterized protein n=1 Tax=Rhizobium mongolense TaxID=57676 RepID=A0A7W6RT54_9HYPH|nr:hypothetical protein [Rhizobium mongolense]MBB4278189.1 hypothetical protein [Rhizobium mongolense]
MENLGRIRHCKGFRVEGAGQRTTAFAAMTRAIADDKNDDEIFVSLHLLLGLFGVLPGPLTDICAR